MFKTIAENYKNDLFKEISTLTKSIASEKRLEILNVLTQSPKTVEAMVKLTGMSFANTSRHLQILKDANLVKTTRDKNNIIYELASNRISTLVYLLLEVAQDQLSQVQDIQDNFNNQTQNILTHDEAKKKMKNQNITLIDLRPKDEFLHQHLENAINIPIDQLEKNLHRIPKDKEVIFYCRGKLCAFSNLASNLLNQKGYTSYSLNESVYEINRK